MSVSMGLRCKIDVIRQEGTGRVTSVDFPEIEVTVFAGDATDLPDLTGYEVATRLKSILPGTPLTRDAPGPQLQGARLHPRNV